MLLSRLSALWNALRRRSRMESALDAELRFHLEACAADLERSGLPPAEARRRARLEFGGLETARDACRQALGLRLFDDWRRDLRYAFRSLRRSPRLAAAIVVSLALGIALNTVVFSYVDAVLFKPFPYRQPEQLVRILRRSGSQISWPLQRILDLRAQSRAFQDVAAQLIFPGVRSVLAASMDHAEPVVCSQVTTNYFDLLGVRPSLGRAFLPGEDRPGAAEVAVLSHAFWRETFGADRSIIGQAVTLGDKPYRVIGVLPPGMFDRRSEQAWIPITLAPAGLQQDQWMFVTARLRPGVPLAAAQQELHPLEAAAMTLRDEFGRWGSARLFLLLWGAVTFVLLTACANVANLLLARAAARRREVAIRLSIGAARFRLVRQFLTESMVLALCGGAAGVLLARQLLPLVQRLAPANLAPAEVAVAIDGRVLLFTLAATLATGLLFGLAPAWHFARPQGLRAAVETRGRSLRKFLLAAETALACVLAAGAGLMLHSFARVMALDPGLEPSKTLAWRVQLAGPRYTDPAAIRLYHDEVLRRLHALREVEFAAAANATPFGDGTFDARIPIDAPGSPVGSGMIWEVTPEYRNAMGLRLLAGRWLSDTDRASSEPVAVVNREFARRHLGGASPLGRRIRPFPGARPAAIVGMVENVRYWGRIGPLHGEAYVPVSQVPAKQMRPMWWTFLVRTRANPSALVPLVRALSGDVDRAAAISKFATMDQLLSRDVSLPRLRTVLFSIFGALALLLAAVGVYSVAHYAVVQRTREIGIRMALGASLRDIILLVVRQALGAALAGLAIGFAAALALARLMESLLFEVAPRDPAAFAGVVVVVLTVAIAAAALPARRAAAIDPMTALRYE